MKGLADVWATIEWFRQRVASVAADAAKALASSERTATQVAELNARLDALGARPPRAEAFTCDAWVSGQPPCGLPAGHRGRHSWEPDYDPETRGRR